MIKSAFLTLAMAVLLAFACPAANTTSLFDPIFDGCKEKVKGGKIRGQKLKGKYDGLAAIKFNNGDIYFGDVRDGKPQGKGVYICAEGNYIKNCPNSTVFVGRFRDGLKHKGTCLNDESEVLYEGMMADDAPSAPYPASADTEYTGYFDVIESTDNGWTYVGEISQGVPNGSGIILFKNKDFLISDFKQGARHGIGLFMASGGEWQTEKAKGNNITVVSSSSYYASIDAERKRQINAHLGEALGYFAQALGNVGQMAAIATGQSYTPSGGATADYASTTFDGEASTNSGNYQADYDMWARRAERHYNSITNLGYSSTNKKGDKHGGAGQGMSGGNYVSMKKSFREAQRQMQNIRAKAAKNGVTIQQSKWETATISY